MTYEEFVSAVHKAGLTTSATRKVLYLLRHGRKQPLVRWGAYNGGDELLCYIDIRTDANGQKKYVRDTCRGGHARHGPQVRGKHYRKTTMTDLGIQEKSILSTLGLDGLPVHIRRATAYVEPEFIDTCRIESYGHVLAVYHVREEKCYIKKLYRLRIHKNGVTATQVLCFSGFEAYVGTESAVEVVK